MADRVDELAALLEVMPGLEIKLTGLGVTMHRGAGLSFHTTQAGMVNWAELHFRGHMLHKFEITPTSVTLGTQIDLSAPGLADIIYKLIDNGAFLNEPN